MQISEVKHIIDTATIANIKWFGLLRAIYKLFPADHLISLLTKKYSKIDALLNIPFRQYRTLIPSRWLCDNLDGIFGAYEFWIPEFLLIRRIINKLGNGAIVDVGANCGAYVLDLRQYTNLPIIAYEPSPLVFALLEKIIEINNMRNIDLRNKACGDKKGPAVLIAGINSSVSTADLAEKIESFTPCNNFNELLDTYRTNGVPTKVDMVTLDEDLIDVEDIAFIKIDCEGYEYQVLSGAKRIMEEDRPFLLVELHPVYLSLSKHGTKELCDLLRHHYDLEFWDFGQLQRENRYLRFLSRYLPNKGYKFSSEEELLEKISKKPTPFQLYILAQPKK